MSLLNPSSIAVIGASADEQKVGHEVLQNLVEQGYKGTIFPINPHGGIMLGLSAFPSVSDVSGTIDLAIIATPASTVEALLEECGRKKIPSVIVLSAGFAEIGTEQGHALEQRVKEIAQQYGIQLVGPNCLGIMRPKIGMNASFGRFLPQTGNVAFLSQSGALGGALIDKAKNLGLGLSLFVSMGNKAVMDECNFLELCAEDPDTKVIGLYLESIRNGRRFLGLCERIQRTKPIVLLKSGTTEQGRRAVSSHTGALAGSDAVFDAFCRQAGVARCDTLSTLCETLKIFHARGTLAGGASSSLAHPAATWR
jgi:acetyltransferase